MNLQQGKSTEVFLQLIDEHTADEDRSQIFADLVSQPITPELIADGVTALRQHMVPTDITAMLDTCGTGGSGKQTINTSSVVAVLAAACGVTVAKHGNKSASGNCGCFDLLEELGVNIQLSPTEQKALFEELGIVFLFAPLHHPAMRFVGPLRKEYGSKTVFNLLGPLCNPAGVTHQVVGTGNSEQAELLAKALQKIGTQKSIVLTGDDGLDEATVCSGTQALFVTPDEVHSEHIDPATLGIELADPAEIEGGTPDQNAATFLQILSGQGTAAQNNLVGLNTAFALLASDEEQDLGTAFARATEVLASGSARTLFDSYKQASQSL